MLYHCRVDTNCTNNESAQIAKNITTIANVYNAHNFGKESNQMKKQQGAIPVLLIIVLAFILLIPAYFAVVLNWAYSDGERAGYLRKVSRKGWICKTYEGELALATMPGVVQEIWQFTVRDPAVAQKMDALIGKEVSLKYEEHRGLLTSCFGETRYFITDVADIKKP